MVKTDNTPRGTHEGSKSPSTTAFCLHATQVLALKLNIAELIHIGSTSYIVSTGTKEHTEIADYALHDSEQVEPQIHHL